MGKREKEESELNQESEWELMISYQRTREMKNQHLQNGKQKRKGKFQENSMKIKMTICGFVMSARKYGMTTTKTVGFCVIDVMQSSICSALDFDEIDEYWNINLENIISHCDGCLSDV